MTRFGVLFVLLAFSTPGAGRAQSHHRTVMVPMRDGTGLATSLFFPDSDDPLLDAILVRTPCGRNTQRRAVDFFTGRGYLVAVQEVRGQGDSRGEWSLFGFSEKNDGYDAVEWLAGQEWSTGKVGMIGGSYVGWATLWTAVAKPPHLVTVISNVTPSEPFRGAAYQDGLLGLGNLDVIGQFSGSPRRDAVGHPQLQR